MGATGGKMSECFPSVTVTGFDDKQDAAAIRRAALRTLSGLGCRRLSVDIFTMERKEAVRLNRKFRGKAYAADVLSFPLPSPVPGGVVGEILLRPSPVARLAAFPGFTRRKRLARLAVHGVLHVLGYGHDDPEQARIMRALERASGG